MPTILNSYSTSQPGALGATLTDLGNTLFGPSALQADLYRKKAQELQLNYDTRRGLGDIAAAGVPDLGNDPNARRFLLQSEDPRKAAQGILAITAGARGFDAPETTNAALGAGESAASTPLGFKTAQSVELQKANMASQRVLDAEKYKADTTPVNIIDPTAPGGTRIVSKADAIRNGAQPVLNSGDVEGVLRQQGFPTGYSGQNQNQLKASGALPPEQKLYNWDYLSPDGQITRGRSVDGKVDLTTGQPLPAGARVVSPGNAGTALGGPLGPDNKQMGDLRGKISSNQELVGLTNAIEQRIKADPTIVGAAGQVQKLGQNAIAAARDAAMALGKGTTVDQSVDNLRQEAINRYGVSIARMLPELFKPGINELETLHGIMVYKTAEALAGQEGRGLSDRDVIAARHISGDPTSWGASSPQVLAHLATIRNLANGNIQRYTTMLNTQNMTNVPAATVPIQDNVPLAGAGAPQPAPAAQPTVSSIAEGTTATNPQTGQRIKFQGGQWIPQ